MRLLPLFLLLFLLPFAYPAVSWSYQATDSITSDVIVQSGNAIFVSYDGRAYALSEQRGTLSWSYGSQDRLISGIALVNKTLIVLVSESGKVVFLNSATGKPVASFESGKKPFSFAASDEGVYLGSWGNATAFSHSGKKLWEYPLGGAPGKISYSGGRLYFTEGGNLHSLSPENGAINWISEADNSFLSTPQEFDDAVYFGATDGRLYSFGRATGFLRFAFKTGGWVSSTPVKYRNMVYFGSNDGYLYALDSSGKEAFKFNAGSAIWGKIAIMESGSRALVVFGANNGKLFAIDSLTGEEIWSFSSDGRIGSPTISGTEVFFGSSSGKVYSISPSPSCSFTSPPQGSLAGNWLLDFDGTAYSSSGINTVSVRLGKTGNWVAAKGGEDWHATLNLSSALSGEVRVECRASDKSGKIESGEFSSVVIVKSDVAPLQKMYVGMPAQAGQNESFLVYVTDSSGNGLHNVEISVGGEKITGDSPFSVVLGRSGNVEISFEKSGFAPVTSYVKGIGGGLPLLPIFAALLLIAVLYFTVGRKLFAKKQGM